MQRRLDQRTMNQGKPIITFESPDASDEERLQYRISLAEALKRCTPLPFTEALGNAMDRAVAEGLKDSQYIAEIGRILGM